MINVRKSTDRGTTKIDWLDSRHTFSFGDYCEPSWMGFGPLRVINEDFVDPGQGFGMHPHRDMEIITYIVNGALEHGDSLGTGSVIRPGDVQRMTAGTGIRHSEFNPSHHEPVHLLQIWILPNQKNLTPSYEQREFTDAERRGKLCLIASQDGRDGAVTIHQDTDVYASFLDPGQTCRHKLAPNRKAWLQLIKGNLMINRTPLSPGDGAAITSESDLVIEAAQPAELLLFDLGG
jgi:redox-sensitive bicupin YhaK (pirin superfamily)